jgi:nitroimidazol reductase NimA-like FMN-containing flavoprotein (pyridoxamine 5'-phosphate oxidase superfamily)
MITMLEHQQARNLLQSARVARLGCIVNGEPYVVPINYHFEGDCLYSHSLQGLKINGLRENPRACVQVDEIGTDLDWRSAIAFGRFEEIKETKERTEILAKLLKRFPMLTPVEAAIAQDGCPMEVVVFRIKIDRITGVSEGSVSANSACLDVRS